VIALTIRSFVLHYDETEGSVLGHGSYVAPDWTADWLHRELTWILNKWANETYNTDFDQLAEEKQAELKALLKKEIRTNTYNRDKNEIIVSETRAEAIRAVSAYYGKVFGDDPEMAEYRKQIAVPANSVANAEDRAKLSAFFFWISWAASTNREGMDITYTNNWPGEPLIDNVPTRSSLIWSIVSVILLIAGVGALAWYFAVLKGKEPHSEETAPERDPLISIQQTPSMKATLKYFWVVTALIVVQVGLGIITAHYAVEGDGLFGIPLAEWLPYSVTRTWHQQLAVFWIATAWLATGLYIGPAMSGFVGFVVTELVLFLQGLFDWTQAGGILYEKEWLWMASVGMAAGIFMFARRRFWFRNLNGGEYHG
jgi:nitric oxide reductase subunit B